jgi:tetratricopeptide (TPR) repeat protein
MKLSGSRTFLALSIIVSLICITGAAWAASNRLDIKVVNDSGQALANAPVEILALGTDGKWQRKATDNNGMVRFDKLNDGVYRIVARPEGLEPALYELVLLRNNAQESVTVTCSPGDPLKKFYFEDPTLNDQARTAMDQAMVAFQSNNFAEAEKNLRASLAANPSNPDSLYYFAVALIQQKKWDEAKSTLEKASRIVNALVAMPGPKDAKGAVQESPYTPVKRLVDNLLPQMPVLKIKVEAGDELAAKNYKQAIAKYEEVLKLAPQDADTYYNLALSQGFEKEWQAAIASIDKAISLRPEDEAFTDLKKRLEANMVMEKAKSIADSGDALFAKKDYSGAITKYNEALTMLTDHPNQASVWLQIARARDMLNQPEEAVKAFHQAIELAPEQEAAKYKNALAQHYEKVAQEFINQKQYDRAFAAYEESGTSLFKLAQNWGKSDETTDLALLAFEHILKTDPQNAEAYFEMGTLYYFNKKDNVRAKEMLTKYLEVGKDEKILEQSRNIIAVIDKKK